MNLFFLLNALCIFLPGLLRLSPVILLLLLHISPLVFQHAEMYNQQFVNLSRYHTHMHADTRTHADLPRPQKLLWCIMTDNWLLWVRPRQQEPITVTVTSP